MTGIQLLSGATALVGILENLSRECFDGITVGQIAQRAQELLSAHPLQLRPAQDLSHWLSVNTFGTIAHGYDPDHIVKKGELFGIDLVADWKGFKLDLALTDICGQVNWDTNDFISQVKKSWIHLNHLLTGPLKLPLTVGYLSKLVHNWASRWELWIAPQFAGHCIGRKSHQEPRIPYGPGTNLDQEEIPPGTSFTVEPLLFPSPADVIKCSDHWKMVEPGPFAHFELMYHYDGCEISLLSPFSFLSTC